jgi:hypothetical protein
MYSEKNIYTFIMHIKRRSSNEIMCSASSFPVFPDISN